jgi:hypothetical protein
VLYYRHGDGKAAERERPGAVFLVKIVHVSGYFFGVCQGLGISSLKLETRLVRGGSKQKRGDFVAVKRKSRNPEKKYGVDSAPPIPLGVKSARQRTLSSYLSCNRFSRSKTRTNDFLRET